VPFDRITDGAKLQRLMQAVLMIEADLSLPVLLRHIVEEARDLVGARYGALGVLNEAGTALDQFITVGLSDAQEDAVGARPTGLGILGLLIVEPEPLRLGDLTAHPDSFGIPPNHPPMTSFLGVPVQSRGSVYGNLYLTDKLGAAEFTDEDEAAASALAVAAGVAIENTRLATRVRDLSLIEDRDRIARDLHDTVIQRLFALGLSLQVTGRSAGAPDVIERIDHAVTEIDDVIRHLRSAIFDLETAVHADGLRRAVLDLAQELTPVVGSQVRVTFDGAVDSLVGPQVAEQLLATLREALTNVGKHAVASSVLVTVAAADDLCLVVIDDGRGFDADSAPGEGHGLRNIQSRAETLGGSLEVTRPKGGGTRLVWRVTY
jgi:signal transduction histidine kinase